MNLETIIDSRSLEEKAFWLLVTVVTLAFAWILWPFYSAILWGTIFAILFSPVQRRITREMKGRNTFAALTTVILIVVVVILPLATIGASLVDQAATVYRRLQSGELDFGRYFQQVLGALPAWALGLLERFDLANLEGVREQLTGALMKGSQFIASRALNIGQNTFQFLLGFFLMLYLLFFFLRDGQLVMQRLRRATPLPPDQQLALFGKFVVVVRATVKGSVVVAILQGALGGLIFWILGINAALFWAVIMAVLSLLPAVGTALVWGPVAAYLLATGSLWQGVVLIVFGVLVIGLVDNVVRPILVGKDTRMPDYVVLISTLGGLSIFGINGIVIGPLIAAMFIAVWDIVASTRPRV